jgi:6,7-dimethyl-8-ribityllumazine synthase
MVLKRIGIVCSRFNQEITERMLEVALRHASDRSALVLKVLHVPGAYDIPFAVQKLLEQPNIDGVATLGAIVQGETGHDEVIARAVAGQLLRLSLRFRKPVSLGITGPRMTYQQAKARTVPAAIRSIDAVLQMIDVNHWHSQQEAKPRKEKPARILRRKR